MRNPFRKFVLTCVTTIVSSTACCITFENKGNDLILHAFVVMDAMKQGQSFLNENR